MSLLAKLKPFLPSRPNSGKGAALPPTRTNVDPRFVVGKASKASLPNSYASPIDKLGHTTKYMPSDYEGRVVPIRGRVKTSGFAIALARSRRRR